LFKKEQPLLYKSQSELAFSESIPCKVDKYASICFGTNHYSVPDTLVSKVVDVKVYSQKLEIFHSNALLATHERNFGRHQWIIAIEHYLDTFKRKPGALNSSVALVSSPYLKSCLIIISVPPRAILLIYFSSAFALMWRKRSSKIP